MLLMLNRATHIFLVNVAGPLLSRQQQEVCTGEISHISQEFVYVWIIEQVDIYLPASVTVMCWWLIVLFWHSLLPGCISMTVSLALDRQCFLIFPFCCCGPCVSFTETYSYSCERYSLVFWSQKSQWRTTELLWYPAGSANEVNRRFLGGWPAFKKSV